MAEDISRETEGVILDPEVSSEIISKSIEESAFMQQAERMTITGSGKEFQTIVGDPEPEWRGETEEAKVGTFKFGEKTIKPYSMDLIVPFSNEFKRDKKGLYDECVRRIPKLFGRKFDRTIMGTRKPGENFDVLGGASATSLTPPTGKTLYDVFVGVDEAIGAADGIMSGIVLAPKGRSKVLGAKDENGHPLFTSGVTSGSLNDILGAKTVVKKGVYVPGTPASGSGESKVEAVPATLGLAGDFENCSWGCIESIRGDISKEATIVYFDGEKDVELHLWQRGMFAVKFTIELAFLVRDPATFMRLTD